MSPSDDSQKLIRRLLENVEFYEEKARIAETSETDPRDDND